MLGFSAQTRATSALGPPVLIVGGSISAWGVIQGLRHLHVPIYVACENAKDVGALSRYVTEVFILSWKDPHYVTDLLDLIDARIGKTPVLMVAGEDDALARLSQNYEQLKTRTIPTFPDWDRVDLVLNKEKAYVLAEQMGIPTIETCRIGSKQELEACLAEREATIKYPVFLKCAYSRQFAKRFKTKGTVCHTPEQVRDAYDQFEGFLGALLLQEYLQGDIDQLVAVLLVLNEKSEIVSAFVNEKVRAAQALGSTSLSVSMWDSELVERAVAIARKVRYTGFVGVQFKFDPRVNDYKFLEINGRFSISVSLAVKCGINMPQVVYDEFTGNITPPLREFRQTYASKVLLWFPLDDLALLVQRRFYKQPLYYLRSVIGHSYIVAPFSLRDPNPSLYAILRMGRRILEFLANRVGSTLRKS